MSNNQKVYNINEMYPALVKARETGNRSAINKKMVEELGINDAFFKQYVSNVERLFVSVCNYVRVKNSPTATETERRNAMEPIYPVWKALLECGEENKTICTLHCNEHDISNLVGHAQKFVNDANNLDFKKDFISQKAWATNTLTQFRKRIETDVGIRIAMVNVLSDEERDLLTAQRRILNKIVKASKKIDVERVEIESLTKMVAQSKSDSEKETFTKKIAEKAAIIVDCEKTIAEFKADLKALSETKTETEKKSAA